MKKHKIIVVIIIAMHFLRGEKEKENTHKKYMLFVHNTQSRVNHSNNFK